MASTRPPLVTRETLTMIVTAQLQEFRVGRGEFQLQATLRGVPSSCCRLSSPILLR